MFVQRDEQGNVKGVYGPRQPGIAEEELPNDHPDVVAYYAAQTGDYRQKRLEAYRARGATETACIEAIIEYMGGKPEKMNALAAIRDSVKQDFPKP